MWDHINGRFNEARKAVDRANDELATLHVRADNDLLEVHGEELRDLMQDMETLMRRIDRLHTDVYLSYHAGDES
jgi:hypothetical protein